MAQYWQLLSWGDKGWGDEFACGLLLTLQVSAISFGISFLFGMAAATAKLSSSRVLKGTSVLYTTIVRSLPELLVILLLYFTVANGVEKLLKSIGFVGDYFQFSAFWAAVIALAFVNGAFMTEVLRAAFLAVPKGQVEAAQSVGMRPFQVFHRIKFPLMMRHAVPGIGNLWLAITKESAIISVLGSFQELLYTGYRAAASTKEYLFFYGFTAFLFLMITLFSVTIIFLCEKRLRRGYE